MPAASFADLTLLALLDQPSWVTRTVESVELIDRHTARRRISRHFILPRRDLRPIVTEGSDKAVRLPVLGVPKGQHVSCDLLDERRRAVSLPPLPERSQHSLEALIALALSLDGNLTEKAKSTIRELVVAGPRTAEETLTAAQNDASLTHLFRDSHFAVLATYLARNYLVYVDVSAGTSHSDVPIRRIIRFELDTRVPHTFRELWELRELSQAARDLQRPFLKWTLKPIYRLSRFPKVVLRRLGLLSHRYEHRWRVDFAGSYHLEVEPIEGVAFGERRLRYSSGLPGQNFDQSATGASSRRARFVIPRTKGPGAARAIIKVRPAPGILRNGAAAMLAAFAALMWAIVGEFNQLASEPAAVSVLLVAPALVSLVAARPNEHPYTTSVVLGIRLLAILPMPLAVVASFVLTVQGSVDTLKAEAIVLTAAALILILGRYLDERVVKPRLTELVDDDLTRIG